MALVLSPTAPIDEWLLELDVQTQRAASFFQGRYVILDLSLMPREDPGIEMLVDEFRGRGVRLIGIEGADPSWEMAVWQLPPMVSLLAVPATEAAEVSEQPIVAAPEPSLPEPIGPLPAEPAPLPAILAEPGVSGRPSLLVERAVRSGQTVTHDKGDVIVIGSVGSGAEIFAGGSIHIYGTLRGRAIAGMTGLGDARIFCRKLDAELLAIGGVYKTADEIEPGLRGRAVQARVAGDEMIVTALD